MQVQSVNNNPTFGNTKGGIKYLKIIKNGDCIRFINSTKDAADVGVFVAGGPEIDRLVREAKIKALNKDKELPTKKTSKKPFFLSLIDKLIKF